MSLLSGPIAALELDLELDTVYLVDSPTMDDFELTSIVPETANNGILGYTAVAIPDADLGAQVWGNKWASNNLTFGFTDSSLDYNVQNPGGIGYSDKEQHLTNFQAFNSAYRAATRRWFDQYAAVSGLSFTEMSGSQDRNATIRLANTSSPRVRTAMGYFPGASDDFFAGRYSAELNGDIWFNPSNFSPRPRIGDYTFITIGHEIGHTLGLKHGHMASNAYDDLGAPVLPNNVDSMEFSIMTYRSYVGHPADGYSNEFYGYAQSLMIYDIAALQYLYGANFSHQGRDTVYSFNVSTGEMLVNGVRQGTPGANRIFRTIWDGSGNDTYRFSNYSTNLSIDLRPGKWSDLDVGGFSQRAKLGAQTNNYARGHVFNALLHQNDVRSLIENAEGGSGNDRIVGNMANNRLVGNAGDDTLFGENGNDILDGGSGTDRLYGGSGNDILLQGFGGPNEILDGGSGQDTGDWSYSAESWIISLINNTAQINGTTYGQLTSIENITGGSGNDLIYGNDVDNVLTGGGGNDDLRGNGGNDDINGGIGNDTLSGDSGSDVLSGNSGNDVLVGYGGGTEYDVLLGGAGADRFTLGRATGVFYLGAGFAKIMDFSRLEGDQAILSGGIGDYTLSRFNFLGQATAETVLSYQGSGIAVFQDNSSISLSQDFIFV